MNKEGSAIEYMCVIPFPLQLPYNNSLRNNCTKFIYH